MDKEIKKSKRDNIERHKQVEARLRRAEEESKRRIDESSRVKLIKPKRDRDWNGNLVKSKDNSLQSGDKNFYHRNTTGGSFDSALPYKEHIVFRTKATHAFPARFVDTLQNAFFARKWRYLVKIHFCVRSAALGHLCQFPIWLLFLLVFVPSLSVSFFFT